MCPWKKEEGVYRCDKASALVVIFSPRLVLFVVYV
jgi:hypothetical protein